MSRHTPGPWSVSECDERGWSVESAYHIYSPAYTGPDHTMNYTNEELKANARLIAAAPEMYDYHAQNAFDLREMANALMAVPADHDAAFSILQRIQKRTLNILSKAEGK